jgi:hypothetical protein
MERNTKRHRFGAGELVIGHLKVKQAVVRRRCLAGAGVGIILAALSLVATPCHPIGCDHTQRD